MKYAISEGLIFKADGENIKPLDRTHISINRMYLIPEDGELNGTPVHEGDVIFTLYERNDDLKFIVSRDPIAKRLALEELERIKKAVAEKIYCKDCEAA